MNIDKNNLKFFQLIAFDLYQLKSDVIRGFKNEYPIGTNINLTEIVNGEVEFYAHCVTKLGVKMGRWEKEGNISDVGKIDNILFRDTSDYGYKRGQEPIKVSENWYVWRLGDLQPVNVGKLKGENKKAEIGLIMNPDSIITRLKTGLYLNHSSYPGF